MDFKEVLEVHGQTQLLALCKTDAEREMLARQLQTVDWSTLAFRPNEDPAKGHIAPITGLRLHEIEENKSRYRQIGIKAVKEGKVAAVLLAGGQGTRLGTDAPKGTYDIGITRPVYIFEQLMDHLKETVACCGGYVPLFIMTSEKNDAQTRAFFAEHDYFGYPEQFVRFFVQEMAPCVDFEGRLLLEAPGRLALSPNGNGGWYASLKRAGADADFPDVEWYNVFGVDNVLQRIADPVFVGATIASGCMSGAKVVCKSRPEEKVGVLCLEDGKPSVIEYYELTEEMANLRDEKGDLCYLYGVILNYLFNAQMLREIASTRIPVHVVKKKIPYLGADGTLIKPEKENGYKFESLILDMVKLAGSCLPFEVVREKEFAPIKNLTGVDSVESARLLLKSNGVQL